MLDIGCGGRDGMALEIARSAAVDVTGVTLSTEQLALAREHTAGSRARFELTDHRDVDGQYDRIISAGMFEHVGVANYDEYCATIACLLTYEGVAVVHSIGRRHGPDARLFNAWEWQVG